MKAVKTKNRERLDLCIILIAAAILSSFSLSIHGIDKLYSFFNAYTDLPLAEFLINVSFLSLTGLLWLTYVRWRKATKRQAELENIISSISPDVLMVVNSDKTIIECNDSLKRMFGYEVDEVIGQKTDFLYFDWRASQSNENDRHEIHDKFKRNGFHIALATGKKKDGKTIPLEIITGNLSGRGGAVQLLRDITERKRAEEVLRESEEKHRTLVEQSLQGLAVIQDFRVVFANTAVAEITGCTPEELLALTPDQVKLIVHPEDRALAWQRFRDRLAGESVPPRHEYRIVRKDGTVRWLETFGTNIEYQGKPAIQAAIVDITDHKRAEEKLRESEKKYRTLIETAQEGIGILDPDENIIFVNQAFADLLGYQKEELLSLNLSQISDKEQFAKFRKETQKRRQGESSRYEAKLHTKTGETKHFSLSVSPLFDDKGTFTGSMGLAADITVHKQAEENLRKAKEEAEEANRLKSEFLANMSHEIRTPMNAIIGMTDITLQTCLTDEQRDYLITVKDSAHALLQLLDDILDLSKIEAGRSELEIIDFDLRVTVEGVADTLAHKASAKGLELVCMIHYQVPSFLRGDPGRLRQILMNLGVNAVKFTEKGEVVIRVELLEETEHRATLLFSVTDTGVGIPKDMQTEIFESFTQADGSTARRYGGTGLGLSISKRLVQLMGGQIGVESQSGEGSRFWFSITFEKQKELRDDLPSIPPDIRGLRILVVDDNKTNRTILVKMLESFGCSAEAVEDGAEALQILKRAAHKEKLFDLVLLDMQMPEMSGEETLHAIKHDPEIKDVALIILTSIGERGDVARLEALGCAGYLLKPIKQSQLFDAIITVLGRQKTEEKGKPSPIVTRHTIAEQKRRRTRILLAEDNPMNQKLAVALLKKAGYSVDAVENGGMAIEALNRTSYDLILMDVQMPEMDGLEATRAIRRREDGKQHISIIAMTAHAMKGDRERCFRAGMDDYVSKPIEPQELFHAIEKWTKSYDQKEAILGKEKSEKGHLREDTPIDLETVLNKFDGDKEFFTEILKEFLNHLPRQLRKLDEAAEKGDARLVEREAHSIKGAASNLGAKRIADLCLKLELLGRTGDLVGAKEMIDNLKTELKHLEKYINKSLPGKVALKP